MKPKSWILLLLVLGLAFFLRIYKVTAVPPSLNWDEVSIGYNAYSILKTGRDEWGKFLPLHFESYGEYKLPAQIYASIPGIAVFGLNPFGVRITPVLYGTLTVLLLFFLSQELFKNKYISLLSALLLAISPWHIQLTRASFESSFSVFWVVMGIWFLIKGLKGNKYWWIVSVVPYAISVYTYNSARVFAPLFIFVVGLTYIKYFLKNLRTTFLAILLFMVMMVPLIPFIRSGEATARFKLVSIVDEQGLVPRINERRGLSKLPPPLPKLIHNKVTYISYYFVRNYFEHFTPSFLFISGAPHVQHNVQGMGELYKFQAPFFLIGLYLLIKRREKYRWILIIWLLIAFIPVAITRDSIPNALRTAIAIPFYQIIFAYGLISTLNLIKNLRYRYLLAGLVILVGLIEFGSYLDNYYRVYPIKYSKDWQYGNKEVVEYIKANYNSYDLIVYTRYYGEPHMFTLFYLNYPPDNYIYNPNLVRFKANDWVWVTNFDKFYFPNLSDKGTGYADIEKENPGKKILFIGRDVDFPNNIQRLAMINFLNGDRAFDIVESK